MRGANELRAGHASIESTRIYLHLADDWLASQYRRAAEVIDAQVFADAPTSPSAPTVPPVPPHLRDRPAPPEPAPVPGFRRLR